MLFKVFLPGGLLAVAVDAVVLAVSGGAAADTPYLQLGLALLAGGGFAAWLTGRQRRKSGEDVGSAAQAVATGAQELAEGAHLLTQPYRTQILNLTTLLAETQNKLAQARTESAEHVIELGQAQREVARIQTELMARIEIIRAEKHTEVGKLAEALVDLETRALTIEQLQKEVDTLKVQLGTKASRRTKERRTPQKED